MVLLALAGCAGPQSILDPAGPSAHEAARLWWIMLAYGAGAWGVVVGLWVLALVLRRRAGPADRPRGPSVPVWIVAGGVVWPLVSITLLLALGIPAGHRMQPLPLSDGSPPVQVEVVGRQWAWEVRYPGSSQVLTNEMRLPAGRAVDVHVRTQDVIHGFWVPRLGGKIDAIPGRTNVIRLQAEAPGTLRGQCAEFCGLRHAHMVMTVHVMSDEAFAQWLRAAPP